MTSYSVRMAVFSAAAMCMIPIESSATTSVAAASYEISAADIEAMRIESGWTDIDGLLADWAQFDADWDGDGAEPLEPSVLENAAIFVAALKDVSSPLPHPTVAGDGEIAFEWASHDGYASASFTSDGHFIAYMAEDADAPTLRIDSPFSSEVIAAFIERIGAFG